MPSRLSVGCLFRCQVRCRFYIPITLIFTTFFGGIYSSDNESNGINEKKYKSKNGTIKDKDREFLGVCCRCLLSKSRGTSLSGINTKGEQVRTLYLERKAVAECYML